MRYAIDEAIKFIGYEGYLRNSITALKVLKRKFLKEKEEPTIPASVSHLTSEELQNLWAWEDIYHSLRKTQDEDTEEHPNAVFLEFERKLMSSKDSQLEEVNLLAARLQGLLAEPRYAHDFVNITIHTKAKSEGIKTSFESNFGLYGSDAALLIEIKIPGNQRAVWKSFSLFFNHPKYHSENISVDKLANNKVAEKPKEIIESDTNVDGSKIVTYAHKFKLDDLVENNTLFLQEVVLHLEL